MTNLELNEIYMYVGSYAKPESKGIHVLAFSIDTGAFRLIDSVSGILNPSFLTISAQNNCLYAVSENGDSEGSVVCYRIDSRTGALKYENEQPSFGKSPCHVQLNSIDNSMMLSNYSSGTIAAYPIGSNGWIGPASQVVNHNELFDKRGTADSHPHSIHYSKSDRYVIVPDLGLDSIFIYKLDELKFNDYSF
jgi:6-phosphogluconolactonase